MTISVLVPYRPDGGHRDWAWAWVEKRWALVPDVELIVRSDDGGANPGEFNHPQAINRAARDATGDVLVVADADTAPDPRWVLEAVKLADAGAPWVLACEYRKLTEAAAALALEGPVDVDLAEFETEWVGVEVSLSGVVVVRRDAFETVGGYDERIAYWGADDVCFACAMTTLCGKAERLPGAVYHLWHPAPLGETYGHDRHRAQHALMGRYLDAVAKPGVMRAVRFGIDNLLGAGH